MSSGVSPVSNLWFVVAKRKGGWSVMAFPTLADAKAYAEQRVKGNSPRAYIYKGQRYARVVSANKGSWKYKAMGSAPVFFKKG